MSQARYLRLVEANLDRWLAETFGEEDKQLPLFEENRAMLLHVLQEGFAHPTLARKAAELVQASHFPEKSGYAREWLPVVRRALAFAADDPVLRARLLNRLGSTLAAGGDLDGAVEAHEAALQLARLIDLYDEFADAHFRLGNVYYHMRDLSRAEHYAREALRLYIEHGLDTPVKVAAAYNLLGLVELAESRLVDAQHLFLKAVANWKKTAQRVYHARTLLNLGNAYNSGGQHAKAIQAYRDALKQLQGTNLPVERSGINLNLGTVYYDQEQWHDAMLYYQLANTPELEKSGSKRLLAMIWTSVGDTQIETDQLEIGERHLRDGLRLWEELGDDPVNHANALGALANLHVKREQLNDAHNGYRRALALLCGQLEQNGWAQELEAKFRRRLAAVGGSATPCPS